MKSSNHASILFVAVVWLTVLAPSSAMAIDVTSDVLIVTGGLGGGGTLQLSEGAEPSSVSTSVGYVSSNPAGFTTYRILTEPTGGVSDVILFTDTVVTCSGGPCLHNVSIMAQSDGEAGIPGVTSETGALQVITPAQLSATGIVVLFQSDAGPAAAGTPSDTLIVTGGLGGGGTLQLSEGAEPSSVSTSVGYVSSNPAGFTTYQILTESDGGVSDVILFTDTVVTCSGGPCLHNVSIMAQSDGEAGIPGVTSETGALQVITPAELSATGIVVLFGSDLNNASVPEPASLMLVITGVLVSGAIAWKRRS